MDALRNVLTRLQQQGAALLKVMRGEVDVPIFLNADHSEASREFAPEAVRCSTDIRRNAYQLGDERLDHDFREQ